MSNRSAAEALRELAACIDAQDWAGMRGQLAPDLTARWVHTGETFDREGLVAVNRDYPGTWAVRAEAVLDAGREAALRAEVTDATGASPACYHVAQFATVDDAGLICDLVEVWTDDVAPHPTRGTEPGPAKEGTHP